MKVRATQEGFYGNKYRFVDDEFDLDEIVVRRPNKSKDVSKSKEKTLAQFSHNWMEWVNPPKEEKEVEVLEIEVDAITG